MKTDDLVAMLARNAEPVAAKQGRGRWVAIGAAALLASFVLMAVTLGLRPDLTQAAADPMFWGKLGYAAALAVAALLVAWRLFLPGRKLAAAPFGIAAPLLLMLALAVAALLGAEAGERLPMLLGATWKSCPTNIALLSIPAVGLLMWLARDFAPTRPALAGAAVGFTGGAIAAFVYSLHCPEMAAPFVAVWYLLGMLIPAAVGALIGRRLLRW